MNVNLLSSVVCEECDLYCFEAAYWSHEQVFLSLSLSHAHAQARTHIPSYLFYATVFLRLQLHQLLINMGLLQHVCIDEVSQCQHFPKHLSVDSLSVAHKGCHLDRTGSQDPKPQDTSTVS